MENVNSGPDRLPTCFAVRSRDSRFALLKAEALGGSFKTQTFGSRLKSRRSTPADPELQGSSWGRSTPVHSRTRPHPAATHRRFVGLPRGKHTAFDGKTRICVGARLVCAVAEAQCVPHSSPIVYVSRRHTGVQAARSSTPPPLPCFSCPEPGGLSSRPTPHTASWGVWGHFVGPPQFLPAAGLSRSRSP